MSVGPWGRCDLGPGWGVLAEPEASLPGPAGPSVQACERSAAWSPTRPQGPCLSLGTLMSSRGCLQAGAGTTACDTPAPCRRHRAGRTTSSSI